MGPLSREKFIRKGVPLRDIVFGMKLNVIYDFILYVVEIILKIKLFPEVQSINGNYYFAPFVNV